MMLNGSDLTYFNSPGGRFRVPRKALPAGYPVRPRVAGRDVSLTREPQTGTSILNIFKATVEETLPERRAQVTVRLAAGNVPRFSRLTRKSTALLDWKPKKSVYVQVNSVALLSGCVVRPWKIIKNPCSSGSLIT
ncbi:MAG: TOBE domain-containing protein [Methylococcales bacterium]